MSDKATNNAAELVQDLTEEDLLFFEDWDPSLSPRPLRGVSLDELTTLAEAQADRLRAMLETGAVSTSGDLVAYGYDYDSYGPINMMTSDPHVARQFRMDYVTRRGHAHEFRIHWGKDGMAVLKSRDGEKISVKLW